MLQLRPNCECCDRDLPTDPRDAVICSCECTSCRDSAERVLHCYGHLAHWCGSSETR
ncbi:MAG: DUF1272 domain-containing protein [Acidisphaera sp.]|nr:DUF1272 domain-containing protein [Acidisphaera sp.]